MPEETTFFSQEPLSGALTDGDNPAPFRTAAYPVLPTYQYHVYVPNTCLPWLPINDTAIGSFPTIPLTLDSYSTSPIGSVNSGAFRIGAKNKFGTPTGLKCFVGNSSRYLGDISLIGRTNMVLHWSDFITKVSNQISQTSSLARAVACAVADVVEAKFLKQVSHSSFARAWGMITHHCQRTGGLMYGFLPNFSR